VFDGCFEGKILLVDWANPTGFAIMDCYFFQPLIWDITSHGDIAKKWQDIILAIRGTIGWPHDRIEFGRDFNPFITGLCCRGCRWHSSTSLYNNAGGWLRFGPFGHACLLRVGHHNDLGRPLEPWLFKIL